MIQIIEALYTRLANVLINDINFWGEVEGVIQFPLRVVSEHGLTVREQVVQQTGAPSEFVIVATFVHQNVTGLKLKALTQLASIVGNTKTPQATGKKRRPPVESRIMGDLLPCFHSCVFICF